MLRTATAFSALLLAFALVHSAPLTTSENGQSDPSINKDEQKVLDELKAVIEQKEAPKAAEATTTKPSTDVKVENAPKSPEQPAANNAQSSNVLEPSAIAMYIFESGNMDGFEKALKEMVDEKRITPEQASQLQESVLREVEQMSTASLAALLDQQRQADAQVALQELAELTDQLQAQGNLRERLYDQIVELYGKQTVLNDEQAAAALQTYIAALAEYAAKGELNENVKDDLVDVIEAALRDVKAVAETTELKDDDADELRKLVNAQ